MKASVPEKYTKAQFWKCALQVNPSNYISYRGLNHQLTEDEYNQELLQVCKDENIKILGIADHGNVDGLDKIRGLMNQNGIIVFPGFEIASSEKVHFVCLFSETTTITALNRYLGNFGLLDPENGIRPTRLSAEQIFSKIENLKGFIYAAHCTHNNGLLKKRLNHIWKNPLLKAAQIPNRVEELKNVENDFYRKVLLNKEIEYKREQAITIINARDVEKPENLKDSKASCLIKMTKPGFDAFKLAFQDPESRVRLNSDVAEKYYSRIKALSVTGGYLDGVHIDFSRHLNSVIGGRGTGKSTLLECIRYALEIEPIGKNALKQHKEIIKENIGKSRGHIELVIRSYKMNGKQFTIARRYGESASVKDEHGQMSVFSPWDLLPEIELYGQNEIYEIAQDAESQRKLLARFLETSHGDKKLKIKEILRALRENRIKLGKALENVAVTEDELNRLPKLEEQLGQFKSFGIENKLEIIPLLEAEKGMAKRIIKEEIKNLGDAFTSIGDVLPDTIFLSNKALDNLPHSEILKKTKDELDKLKKDTETILARWQRIFFASKFIINTFLVELNTKINEEEEKLERTFKALPSSEGKSGREIGVEFQRLLKDIEKIKLKKTVAETQKAVVDELKKLRKSLLAELSSFRATRSSQFERSLKSLNKRLKGKLKLILKPEADRKPVIDFLLDCNLDNVGEKRLSWIHGVEDFSSVKLAELIEKGSDALTEAGWGITPTTAGALVKLSNSHRLQLEELELPDIINIELNISHEGQENYRMLGKLSTGQQCTAILHLLLLQNNDPLIMDQPEDNLDNAFIADRIVAELRNAKINRQFIFATHNANIPVFGDAEWIGIFDSSEGQAHMPSEAQGGIDVKEVRDKAANILEGGKTAFNQRKDKYGY